MITKKALRAGINKRVKRLVGLRYARTVENAWSMTTEEFWAYQAHQVFDVYAHARQRVPYYQQHPELYPAIPDRSMPALQFLSMLPTLPKSLVRSQMEDFYAKPLPPLTTIHTTSGTSGSPLRIPATLWERGFATEIYDAWEGKVSGRRAPRTLFLSGFMTPSSASGELAWSDPLSGHCYMSIYSLCEANRQKIVDVINTLQPEVIFGYSSTVHTLARVLGDAVADTKGSRVVIVTSEILYPSWREEIEATLCRGVYDMYGSQEGCHLILQCSHKHMHIHPLVGIVEVVDENNAPVAPGELGRVLVTGLIRQTMPLFRYELGDTVESTGYATDCPCGLGWPTIGAIQGRSEDLVVTRDGRRIGYLCFHSTKNIVGIAESQLVQVDFERFIFNIVLTGPDVDKQMVEGAILQQLRNRMLTEVSVEFRYLDEIPRGARGKFKSVVVEFDSETKVPVA